jgi:hypothetical protein
MSGDRKSTDLHALQCVMKIINDVALMAPILRSFKYTRNKLMSSLGGDKPAMNDEVDEKGSHFGSKTAMLEAIGLLLPFLSIPEELAGRFVMFKVDNAALVFGWLHGGIKHDETAAMLIQAMIMVASYLGTEVHEQHVPRCSEEWAIMADSLSRRSTTTTADRFKLRHARRTRTDDLVLSWLRKPVADWSFPNYVLASVQNKMELP